jgi:hypothetical protein
MPNRILRDWTDSYAVNDLDAHEERFFVRLIMKVDDFGRFHADSRLLKANLFPLLPEIRDTDITRWLAACEKAGMVRCYVDAKGRQFLEIQNFRQRTRQSESKFPAPSGNPPTRDGQLPPVQPPPDDNPPRNSQPTANRQPTDSQPTANRQPRGSQLRTYSETETETEAHAREDDPRLARIESIEQLIRTQYCFRAIDSLTDGQIKTQTGLLNSTGESLDTLAQFFAERQKLPGLNFVANEFQRWLVNSQRPPVRQNGHETQTHYADGREKPDGMKGFVC